MNHKKILITGAKGFTGQHACEYFTKNGFDVYGLTRDPKYKMEFGTHICCDLEVNEEVEKAVKSILPQYVLHLGGRNNTAESWERPGAYLYSNVMGTVNLLESIRAYTPDAKIIVVGSMLQHPLQVVAPHPYSLTKTMQVLVALTWEKLFKLNVVIAKPCNLIGPGHSSGVCSIFARNIVAMEKGEIAPVLQADDLNTVRDFLDVRDAIRGYGILIEKGVSGETYELGTGISTSIGNLISCFQEKTSISIHVQSKQNTSDVRKERIKYEALDKMKALGWSPEILLSESLNDILNYHRNRGFNK
jgi:GDP-4-dehydro-6-deoxy-D-mannose reductase